MNAFAKTCLGALVLAVMLETGSSLANGAQALVEATKISGRLRLHQSLKARPANTTVQEHRKRMQALGFSPDRLDREKVAFYVANPLSQGEIKAYAAQGILIDTNNWVPPIPGRHPYGYYLAEVPLTRLGELATDARVTRLDTTEIRLEILDDAARTATQVEAVHAGAEFISSRTGAGIKVAIADNPLDRFHPDFTNNPPIETYDMSSGTGTNNWSTNVAGLGQHGTHVSGIVVGSGTNSGGLYRGVAPGAQWAFYKIADTNGYLHGDYMIRAVNRAAAAGFRVFNMSAGSLQGSFLDGSEAMDQAVDAAVASNCTVFISAGNHSLAGYHTSFDVAPGNTSPEFFVDVNNTTNSGALSTSFTLTWRDNGTNDGNIELVCNSLRLGMSFLPSFPDISPRGTERRTDLMEDTYPLNGGRRYFFRITNSATTGPTPKVHLYVAPGVAGLTTTLQYPDPNYTIFTPAVADGAIAVGAYTHRNKWSDCSSILRSSLATNGMMADFSSRGPRIDGLQKPDVAAPGYTYISTRSLLQDEPTSTKVPDNAGGCSYLVASGTSMASPHAAGLAALLLEAQPSLTPADLRTLLTTTASRPATRDTTWGYGLLNASNGVFFAEANLPGVWVNFSYAGVEEGNFARPFNSITDAAANAPSAAPAIIPRIRIGAGNHAETLRITNGVRLEAYGGPVRFGTP
jgi:subtilisin family serine protease